MFKDILIAPSILSADFMSLGKDVCMVADAGADWIHVDVMDGHFVPNLTIGPAHVKALKQITDVPLDVHLMISNPELQVPWYLESGADLVTFHREAVWSKEECIALADRIHEAGAKAGIAVNPETSVTQLEGMLGSFDLILVMSVHPGFGGQSFIESTPAKIAELVELCKAEGAEPLIEVDGGIGVKTASLVTEKGADMLVAGSAIFCAENPARALEEIRDAGTR